MKLLDMQAAIGAVIVLLSLPCEAKHEHSVNNLGVFGKRHQHKRARVSSRAFVERDGGSCAFPTNAGLVAVTPGAKNRGWAMSPDQECVPDSFCPYACPPGKVMAQWNPDAKNYPDPKSMVRGIDFLPQENTELTGVGWWIVLQQGWKDYHAIRQQAILCGWDRHSGSKERLWKEGRVLPDRSPWK